MSGSVSGFINPSLYVAVNPSVISAGGSAFSFNGLMLTNGTRVPIGTVLSFPNLAAVGTYFGLSSAEYGYATQYFGGYIGSPLKPGALLISQYPWTAPVAAFLRGASLSAISLTTLQGYTGTLILTVNGTLYTSSSINLASATSFSNAATIIQAGFTTPPFTVTYDSVSGAFVFTSSTTGSTSTITFCTGTLAANLLLSSTAGGVISQGSAIYVPGTAMANIVAITPNFFSFATTFEPVLADKLAFAAWVNTQNDAYMYAMWDTTQALATGTATNTAPQNIVTNGYNGTAMNYLDPNVAFFTMGAIASVNVNQKNGAATMAFKSPSTGLSPTVYSTTTATNLRSYLVNFLGITSQQNTNYTFLDTAAISGNYKFIDAYAYQAWLTSSLQAALLNLLTSVGSVPYNAAGYALIAAACQTVINTALNFGAISSGVTLSALQIAEVNNNAGLAIDPMLSSRGWYLQITPANAQQRAARTSPSITLWYTYAGSVQQITLQDILVQ